MLFGMLVLIAQPRLAPRRLAAVAQHRDRTGRSGSPTAAAGAAAATASARTRCRRRRRSCRPAAPAARARRTPRAGPACDAARQTNRRRRTRRLPGRACCRSVSTNRTRSMPNRRAASAPSRSDARDRSAPTTTRSARARYRHIWPVPQPTSTIRASPGIAAIEQARKRLRSARAKRVQLSRGGYPGTASLVEPADDLGARSPASEGWNAVGRSNARRSRARPVGEIGPRTPDRRAVRTVHLRRSRR